MKILVCGGRDFNNMPLLDRKLNELKAKHHITDVIHGGAKGADYCAWHWGLANGLQVHVFHADWKKHGKAAGPIRNQRMIDEGKPDLVVAFPGGKGTQDMVSRALGAGIEVLIISE
jgi:hypothetical protein